jgi:hypothetical protein
MSSVCPGILLHVPMCIIGLLEMISIPVMASDIRVYLFIFIKVVVCLLSKNIGGNDLTSHVLLSLMLFYVFKMSDL